MVISYDMEEEVGELYDLPVIATDLGYRERKEAEFLKSLARGVMLITGKPGSGKDLFATSLTYLLKRYFGRKALLDFMPRKLFGEYTLFNAKFMMSEINKMAKATGVDNAQETLVGKQIDKMEDLSKQWVADNEILLKNGVLYLSELKRYCYNRHPHNPFNKFIGSICTVWRHLDLLIIGTHVQMREIDQFSFLYYVTHWAKCSWSLSRPNTTDVTVARGAFIGNSGVYDVASKNIVLHVDGDKPRAYLNDHRFYDLYHTKNMVNLRPVLRKEM